MAIRDLRVYAEAEFARLSHYRDNTGLEIDLMVEYPDLAWAGVEVKLGDSGVALAEKNLLTLRDARMAERYEPPSFLAVITGGEYAYTLPSGVHVIPLASMAP